MGRFLRWPLKTFYTDRLALYFTADDTALADDETFTVDGLEKWQLSNAVLAQVRTALAQQPDAEAEMLVTMATQRLVRTGELPLPPFAQQWSEALLTTLQPPVARYQALLKQFALALPGEAVAVEIPPAPFASGDQAEAAGIFLEDTLAAVRTDDAGNRVRLQLQASRLHIGKDLKWTRLAPVWPGTSGSATDRPDDDACACDRCHFQIAPLPAATAQTHLLALLAGYRAALTAPLPLACKTGFAWLAAQTGTPVNRETAYEGEEFKRDSNPGEVFEHPGYRRFWPTYAALEADERFQPLLAQLYQPLFDHASTRFSASDAGAR